MEIPRWRRDESLSGDDFAA